MAIERISVTIPANFDPQIHSAKLVEMICAKQGPGWALESFSRESKTAWLTRRTTATKVEKDSGADALVADLPIGTKPSDGDRVAAQFADAYPGYHLVKFDPHVGRAVLAKMTEPELRCRYAVATALGVKPWEVMVRGRRDGGYNLQLPNGYTPSKHDTKLQEVAESVVGRFGWYVDIDPKKLTAQIVPSDPATFPPVVPFPFDDVRPIERWDAQGDAERFTFKLAEGLGEPGKPNFPVEASLDDANSLLIVGLPGSGKELEDSTMLPVPVSERFPSGWARNDELIEGDELYAPDGTLTRILGFSDWRVRDRYLVTFGDGQTVSTGAGHLWKARDNRARVVNSGANGARPTKTSQTKVKADGLRSKASQYIGTGAVATLTDIAAIAGYGELSLYGLRDRLTHLETKGLSLDSATAWSYRMDDLISYWKARPKSGPARGKFNGYRLTEDDMDSVSGSWMTGLEFARHLVERGAPEDIARSDRASQLFSRAKAAGAHMRLVPAPREVSLYPVDETLMALAESFEANAPGRKPLESIVTTAEMMDSLRYGKEGRANWAVRISAPIDGCTAELPVDPWLLGAWLGDGSKSSGNLCAATGCDADFIRSEIEKSSEVRSERDTHNKWGGSATSFQVQGLTTALRHLGVLGDKRIPATYLRAGFEQRLSVLQGIMDTDGHIDAQGHCELALSKADLANDALELIRSLGIKATMTVAPASYRDEKGELVQCQDRHRIHFTTELAVFRMPRKAERLPARTREVSRWNYVENIAIEGQARLRCIKVDHPEHLFLVEGFIPTHNSIAVRGLVAQALVKGFRVAVIDTPAKRSDYAWLKPYVEDHWWGCEDSGSSVAEALTVASLLDDEGKRLGALCESYGVSKWQELPEEVKKANPPILVVADELANLLSKPNVPSGLTKEAKALPMFVEMAQNYMESKLLTAKLNALVAVHRAVGMREAYLSQRPSKTEGFPPELKSLIPHRVQLGPNPSDADLAMAFRDPKRMKRVPANIAADESAARGAGLAHLDGSDPVVIKGYWAPDRDYEALIRKYLGPGDPSDARVRPTAAQIAKYVPRVDGDGEDLDEAPAESSFAFGQERLPSGKPVSSLDPKFGPMAPQYDENGKKLKGAAAAAKASKAITDASAKAPAVTCFACDQPIDPLTGDCGCS